MSSDLLTRLDESVAFLRERACCAPRVGVVLGSGWDAFGDGVGGDCVIRYGDVPHFPQPGVHAGVLRVGTVAGKSVACLRGRCHGYEGYSPEDAVFPIRVLAHWGVKFVVLTNAAGGIADRLNPGDIMIVSDHVNLTATNPLVGAGEALGPQFVDMTEAYDAALRRRTESAAVRAGIAVQTGVYAATLGPMYETPAEIRAMRTGGVDAIGMSTVWETIALRQMGVPVLGITCITNRAAGLGAASLSHHEVLMTARAVSDRCVRLLTEVIDGAGE